MAIKLEAVCTYCNESVKENIASMKSHLKKCKGLAEQKIKLKSSEYALLKVEATYTNHWLTIKVHPNVFLSEIDAFLRKGWLECCGHMSQFSIGTSFSGETYDMNVSLRTVLEHKNEFSYVYDFGTSTELKLKLIDYQELPNDGNIVLVMQNKAPEILCSKCGKQRATEMCFDCIDDQKENPLYCSKCIEKHGHLPDNSDYEESAPFINSPRAGECAYDGPVDFSDYFPSKKEIKPARKKKEADSPFSENEDDMFGGGLFGPAMFSTDDDDFQFDPTNIQAIMQSPLFLEMMQQFQNETGVEIGRDLPGLQYSLFLHYKFTADKAMAGLSEEAFFFSPNEHSHSVAAIVNHLTIHLKSNWTNPFNTDANKFRETLEFKVDNKTKEELIEAWEAAWKVLYRTIESLNTVTDTMLDMQIEGQSLPFWYRLTATIPHYAYHIGQIVQMSKIQSTKWAAVFDMFLPDPQEHLQPKTKEISLNTKKKKK
jgi:hypothetical protein